VDLGLHHGDLAAKFIEGVGRFFAVADDDALGNGDLCLAQEFLGLIFVNFHG
jgi:hypothetical protein